MALGELLLVSFFKVLFEKLAILASGELLNFARGERIHTLLIQWSRKLVEIEAVLADAEEKQITERGVNVWLEDLEDLAYDLDDILDEFSTEAFRRKAMEEPGAGTSKVLALIPTCCTSFNPSTLMSDFRIRSKIDEITTRLQVLFERRRGLGLQKVASGTSAKVWQRPPTTSLMNEPRVYGRDKDEKEIIELLLSDNSSNNKVDVVPIVGMGGVGKTTLAQMVYNNETTNKHFDLKAWVCVSDEFDIIRLTKEILESVTSQTCNFSSLDQLQVKLKQAVGGKKFLIVLDDVWNQKHWDWSSLKSPFSDGARGSRVMVTTRNSNVALMMGTVKYHELNPLSKDDCWSVFAQHAFENRTTDASPNLVSIGMKLVEKCGGLALAARTLGGLLRCKVRDDEWEDVLNSKMWQLSDEQSDIFPALRLSYYHLPSHLKKCFAYCSILPKDYEFEEEELVLLWMAEGFIQQPMETKQIEDLGCEYFRELVSRSFFQPSSTGKSSRFMMHDLLNDLAQFVAKETCFRLEDKSEDNTWCKNISKARHSSYPCGYCDGIKKFEVFYKAKNLRTFLSCAIRVHHGCLTNNVPLDLLPKLNRLRVLSFSKYRVGELPSSIGDLKHLRYLDLSNALFRSLPESLGNLFNLQTLKLRYCGHLKKLPTSTGDLINLRHLDITGARSLQEMPPKIGKLSSLRTLSKFIISKGNGFMIRELGSLIHLKGRLQISGLENVAEAVDARGASLKDKQGLDVLSLKWSNSSDDSRNERVELDVLDMLQPHKKLKELTITFYQGPMFPAWVGDPQFSNMVHLKLENIEKCTSLPPLGCLPSLERLGIEGMKALKNVGLEFYGSSCSNPFPSLKTLSIWNMLEWEDWSPTGVDEEVKAFARLSTLSIHDCPKLKGQLPTNLPCLGRLEIGNCPELVVDWLPSFTVLHQMRNTLHCSSKLTELNLSDVPFGESFPTPEVAEEMEIGTAARNHLASLTSICLGNIPNFTCLPCYFFQELTRLQRLKIDDCEELTTLWQNKVRLQNCLPSLRRLVIEGCPQLMSLLEEEEEKEGQQQQQDEGLPFMLGLEYLQISNCEKLKKLHRGLKTIKSLQELIIDTCPCIISFPDTGFPTMLTTLRITNCLISFADTVLPSTLRTLHVGYCEALQSLPELPTHNNLEKLVVVNCPSLIYLWSKAVLLPILKELTISSCGKLELLLAEAGMRISCPSLESISICGCENLKCLPDVMQSIDLKNLSRLNIRRCNNLESLPEGWCNKTNLKELSIFNCEKLQDLLYQPSDNNLSSLQRLQVSEVRIFPAGIASNFPNLSSFSIGGTNTTKPPSEWGLYRLSYLRELCLQDLSLVSFPEDGLLFPTSLIKLSLESFSNMEKLSSKAFQNLISLEELTVDDFPMLTSFVEQGLPPSLLRLNIYDCHSLASFQLQQLPPLLLSLTIHWCPNLASFPAQVLPPTLVDLVINGCSILKQRCERRRGQYWPFIAHIPHVKIDGQFVFASSS